MPLDAMRRDGATTPKKPLYRHLYVQVLAAIALGALFGWLAPDAAAQDWVKALGDGFVKLIKMAIAPIIFCTVVSGVAHIEDARKVGRVGLKALLYFEIVSTFALALGLLIGNLAQVGAGFAGKPDPSAIAKYTALAEKRGGVDFLLDIIPDSAIGAFAKGDILQVLLFSLLFGFALLALGERGRALRVIIDDVGHAMFGVIAIIMKAAPIGAFGAMAYTVGEIRLSRASVARRTRRSVLSHGRALRRLRAGRHRARGRFQHLQPYRLSARRAAHRARHILIGKRPARSDGEAAMARLLEVGRRTRRADRLFLQSRRHQHLYDADDAVHRARDGRRA